ncbi:NUDIX hydrolase [Patescibacteria group bacterium]|nr:NUDIX hydrolase [Patescibacteria group bacterium]
MRKGVDHIGVGVVFFCHDGNGNILMSKRSKNTRDEHGRWDPGGGSIELGESFEDALKREIKEEYCTEVIESDFLGFRDVHRIDEKGNKTHWVVLDFKVLIDKDKVKNGVPNEHEEIGWFRLDNLPSPVHSQFPIFLKNYKNKLK